MCGMHVGNVTWMWDARGNITWVGDAHGNITSVGCTFLNYFVDWYKQIERHGGNYPANAKSKMFISYQACLAITVNSLIICLQFFLGCRFLYIITDVFCRDFLENYFSKPEETLDNIIKSQFIIRSLGGNVRQHCYKEKKVICLELIVF